MLKLSNDFDFNNIFNDQWSQIKILNKFIEVFDNFLSVIKKKKENITLKKYAFNYTTKQFFKQKFQTLQKKQPNNKKKTVKNKNILFLNKLEKLNHHAKPQ